MSTTSKHYTYSTQNIIPDKEDTKTRCYKDVSYSKKPVKKQPLTTNRFNSNKENSMGITNSKVSAAPVKDDVTLKKSEAIETKEEVVVTNLPSPPKKNLDVEEPLLKPNPRRFVLFPIQY